MTTAKQITDPFPGLAIGLTGGIATGKSSVASVLRGYGYLVLDADQITRDLTEQDASVRAAIGQVFGPDAFDDKGGLRRGHLRTMIFRDEGLREELEKILHPAIHREVRRILKDQGVSPEQIWFYEASLIFEKGREASFYEVWVTDCEEATQKHRLSQRDGVDEEAMTAILRAQWPLAKKRAKADRVIDTEPPQEVWQKALQKELTALGHRKAKDFH